MYDRIFTTLRCPCKLLLIIKDGAHISKTKFMLVPGSGVKLTPEPGWFETENAKYRCSCTVLQIYEQPSVGE